MDERQRYTVEELERMTSTERQSLAESRVIYTNVDDVPEPFRTTVRSTISRIDEIHPPISET